MTRKDDWGKLYRDWWHSESHFDNTWRGQILGPPLITIGRAAGWREDGSCWLKLANKPLTAEALHRYIKGDEDLGVVQVQRGLDELVDAGTLALVDGQYVWPNFREYQQNHSTRRVQEHRKRKAVLHGVSSDVSCNANETTEEKRIEENRIEEITISPEPIEDDGSEPRVIMTYPVTGKTKTWNLREDKLAEWTQCFPHLDVLSHLREARQYVIDVPQKRKTPRGMTKFLFAWLSRVQNRSGGRGHPRESTAKKMAQMAAQELRMDAEPMGPPPIPQDLLEGDDLIFHQGNSPEETVA